MAVLIITPDDFKGFQAIASSIANETLLQMYIDRWEKYYIYHLLSNNKTPTTSGLADLFIATLVNGVPVGARYLKIFNEFFEQDGQLVRCSKGMKDILVSCVFYHFVTDSDTRHTQSGVANALIDAANKSASINATRYAERRWNDALETIENIKWWLKTGNSNGGGYTDYPEYIDDAGNYPTGTGGVFKPKYSALL